MRVNKIWLGGALLLMGIFTITTLRANNSSRDQQRLDYKQAQKLLTQKDDASYQALRPRLKNYPLLPYTDYRSLLLNLDKYSPQEMTQKVVSFETLPLSTKLRAAYITYLAKEKRWQDLLIFQPKEPSRQSQQCLYYQAQLNVGNQTLAWQGANKLWKNGKHVADQCDALFSAWNAAGKRTDTLILDRMLLAFDKRNTNLLRYLSKLPQSNDAKKQAKVIIDVYQKPSSVLRYGQNNPSNEFNQKLVELGYKKWVRSDAEQALLQLEPVAISQKLSSTQTQQLKDYVVFRVINTDNPATIQWRDAALMQSQSVAMLERRAQLAVQHADWQGVKQWIALIPTKDREKLRWQYWLGRAQIGLGDIEQGRKQLESILGIRHFYSVAAAQTLDKPITFPIETLTYQSKLLKPYQASLTRVAELIAIDKIAAAKSQWRWLLDRVSANEKAMLSAYAAGRHWHHLTVVASISAKIWDTLDLRFPLAHKGWFDYYAKEYGVSPVTLMALARQESAFDVEANSPVGARGLMQLMPATAKMTARKYNIEYSHLRQLNDARKNIEIGSRYFSSLMDQYDNNRIFSLAAYNAGPNRVKQWRKRSKGQLDPIAFIELIPFKETRGYVQNVLMFEVYFHKLQKIEKPFLTSGEVKTRY